MIAESIVIHVHILRLLPQPALAWMVGFGVGMNLIVPVGSVVENRDQKLHPGDPAVSFLAVKSAHDRQGHQLSPLRL